MQRYQQSDSAAAALLVEQLSPQIYKFYLARTRNQALAEDLLQDFWLRLHNARQTYRPGQPVLPWIYAIARRVQIDDYRRTKSSRIHEVSQEHMPDYPAPAVASDSTPGLMDMLKTLPATQQEVILMMKVSGLSLEEVARATGSTAGAVKQKAHRAYQTLRKSLTGEK